MAHRRTAGALMSLPFAFFRRSATILGLLAEPEEGETIPAGAGDIAGDVAEGSVVPPFVLKTVIQYLHHQRCLLVLLHDQASWHRETGIVRVAHHLGDCCQLWGNGIPAA